MRNDNLLSVTVDLSCTLSRYVRPVPSSVGVITPPVMMGPVTSAVADGEPLTELDPLLPAPLVSVTCADFISIENVPIDLCC